MSRRKPRGRLGWLVLGTESSAPRFVDLQLPDTKSAIEEYILTQAILNARRQGVDLFELTGEPVQNRESDYDFTLPTQNGEHYLDLVEIMPLEWVRGKHGDAPGSYANGSFADAVFSAVAAKAQRYHLSRHGEPRVHLLLYPTDWRLRVGESVQQLLATMLARDSLGFASVSLYQPEDDMNGLVSRLFPAATAPLSLDAESSLRNKLTLLADLTDFRAEPDGSVSARVLPPPLRNPKGGT